MSSVPPPLKLFAYDGRESGVMVVGTSEALQELAAKLQASASRAQELNVDAWPSEVVATDVALGPYKDSENWRLSFHVEGAVPAERAVRLLRRGPSNVVAGCVLVLATVGCFSLVRWALNVF